MYEVVVVSSRNEIFFSPIDVGDPDPSDLLALMAHSPSARLGLSQVAEAISPLRETPQT
jgi:hypothetical protein